MAKPTVLIRRCLPLLFLIAASCADSTSTERPPDQNGAQSQLPAGSDTNSPRADETADPLADSSAQPGPDTNLELTVATVERFIDGDSLELAVDGSVVEVRLIGINTPEGDECLGDVAADRLATMLGEGTLRITGDDRDDFGRRLIVLYSNDTDVSRQLVAEGLAVARDQSGHPNAELYEIAERAAIDAELGLWSPGACGDATTAEIVIVVVEANAPGRDNENPNGEWIELRNDGNTVDLSGWVIRDESTRHRYEFPGGFSFEAGATLRLFSGQGDETASERYWGKIDDAVWNNSGDTAFVLDANGSTVAVFGY